MPKTLKETMLERPAVLEGFRKASRIGPEPSYAEKLDEGIANDKLLGAGNIHSIKDFMPMAGTTIGPKAVPLGDDLRYLHKVLGAVSEDTMGVRDRLYHDPSTFHKLSMDAKDILGNLVEHSDEGEKIALNFDQHPDKNISDYINYLAKVFLPSHLR